MGASAILGDTHETIAAVASAAGGAARGLVRLSGDRCLAAVAEVFEPQSRSVALTSVREPQQIAGALALGPPLGRVPAAVLVWPTRRSYTRQPAAELHTVGSPPILEAILARLCDHGARIARPGEFTLRAFLAGRIDLTQAEAVLGVIDAKGQRELSAALAQLAGGLARPLNELRDRLLDLLAHLEAGLDFVDEDIEFISRTELLRQLEDAAQRIEALAGQMRQRATASMLPRVVLAGPPNVGKSSLFNALCGSASAIVSEVAGTTRDYVSRRVPCGSIEIELIDTAGIESQQALSRIDAAARDVAHAQAEQATIVLACREASEPLLSIGGDTEGGTRIEVITKCDELFPAATADGAIRTSSRTGQGIGALKIAIESVLASESSETAVVPGTAARCRESLAHAAECLHRARDAAVSVGEEFVAAEVRNALEELGLVVGAVYTDEVLDRIFSRFCIGK